MKLEAGSTAVVTGGAHRILRGIKRERNTLFIGWDSRTIGLANRLAPRLSRRMIAKLWRRLSFL